MKELKIIQCENCKKITHIKVREIHTLVGRIEKLQNVHIVGQMVQLNV